MESKVRLIQEEKSSGSYSRAKVRTGITALHNTYKLSEKKKFREKKLSKRNCGIELDSQYRENH